MAKNIFLNIFFNLAIFTLIACDIWLFNRQHYGLMAGATFGIILFIYFKIRLIRQVKADLKSKKA